MGFFKRLAGLFSPGEKRPETSDKAAYWIYVQCNRCGEKLRTRINLHNDLSINYGEGEGDTTYFCRKTIMGNQLCFQRIEVELTFDAKRQLLDRQIQGGKFIEESEYDENA